MTDEKRHGGPGRGQGRKTIVPGEPLTKVLQVRVTETQFVKVTRLGGPQWVRDRIARAKAP